MNREEDPQLWDLLGRAKTVEPSPFFARNVLRTLRAEPAKLSWLLRWRQARVVIPALSAVAAIIVTAFVLHGLQMRGVDSGARIDQIVVSDTEDSDASDLDLLASSDDESDDSLLL